MYKLRSIAYHNGGEPIKGITIPSEIAVFFENTYFTVAKSGTSIILTSGTHNKLTKQEIESFDLESIRV